MKTVLKIMIIMIILSMTMSISVFASTLTLKVTSDQSKYEVGDKVVITVDWTEKMQAASFKLKYDSDVLEFKSASIADMCYDTSTEGVISVNWTTVEEKDLTKMTFEFTALKTGSANISIKEVVEFCEGNLVRPTEYNFKTEGSVNISVNKKSSSENNNTQNTKNIENTVNGYNAKDNSTTNSTKLPNAGIKTLFIPITIIGIIGVIGHIKFRRLSGI